MKNLTTIIAAAIAAIAAAFAFTSAPASAAEGPACHVPQKGMTSGFRDDGKQCFEFEGHVWTVTGGVQAGVPLSRIMLTHDFHLQCPQLAIKLESTKKGPAMTAEQKFRGDARHHVVCDYSAPIPGLAKQTPIVPPAAPAAPVAPTENHTGSNGNGWNPNGTINVDLRYFQRI